MKTLADPDDRRAILERIKTVQPGARALWGRMSAHQMICHCADSFRTGLGEKSVARIDTLFHRTVFKWGALYLPLPWPKGVPSRPEVEQGKGGTAPGEFGQDRRELILTADRFSQSGSRLADAHPLFGPMSEGEWRRWGYLHMDHHLRQFGA